MNPIAIKVGVAVGIGLFSLAVGLFSYIYSNRQNRNPPQGITPENRNPLWSNSEGAADLCCICLEEMNSFTDKKKVFALPCQHRLHLDCMKKMLSVQNTENKCPYCRRTIEGSIVSRIMPATTQ